MIKDPEDRPGNIHYTGDDEFNERQKRIGTKRYSGEVYEDDDGPLVAYHNFCAAIRTKVSTIHTCNEQWAALVILAHYLTDKQIEAIKTAHRDMHPESVEHIRTAFERSRDDWRHYVTAQEPAESI